MKVLVDTNILVSALISPKGNPAQALLDAAENHELILCDQNIAELKEVIKRKAPKYLPAVEILLAELSYELIPAVTDTTKEIRDANDQPILNAAIINGVDIILTGDKDFLEMDIDKPKCISAADYLNSKGVIII